MLVSAPQSAFRARYYSDMKAHFKKMSSFIAHKRVDFIHYSLSDLHRHDCFQSMRYAKKRLSTKRYICLEMLRGGGLGYSFSKDSTFVTKRVEYLWVFVRLLYCAHHIVPSRSINGSALEI